MANQEVFGQLILRGVQVTENELGHGSYAAVIELKYRGLKCAGKKLYRVLYESGIGHAARRYLEECQLLSQTRHPHIVQFIGVFFEEGSQLPILVMEFLPTNLSSCLDQYDILSDEISYSILHDVSLGLSYLHGQTPPIVHRDLSANNVLLSKDMTAKISDLGVSRILNLTHLQTSRMTETPGTPAYMPPEVMVADPHYYTSVDVFSFGVLMINTFTAEWPLPKIGPTRVDPADPDRVIGVTEAERREEFLRKIAQDHPLMDLIMRCISNNPQRRPRAEEIVGRMEDIVLQYPPSFENRVEMLQQISTLDTEKRKLEQEIMKKDATIEEKSGEFEQLKVEESELLEEIARKETTLMIKAEENDNLSEEKKDLMQEIVKKNLTIEHQAGEVERLNQERKELEQEVARKDSAIKEKAATIEILNEHIERSIETKQLIHSVETEQLQSEIRELKGQLEGKEALVEELSLEVEGQIMNFNFMDRERIAQSTKITELENELERERRASIHTSQAVQDHGRSGDLPRVTKVLENPGARESIVPASSEDDSQEDKESATEKPHSPPSIPLAPRGTKMEDLQQFVQQPAPGGTTIKCLVTRDRTGTERSVYPIYYLHLERGGSEKKLLLAARKRKKSRSSNYLVSTDPTDLSRGGKGFIGKVRSNYLGTSFTIYNNGSNPKQSRAASNKAVREELAAVCYDTNVLRLKGPRKMTVIIPAMTYQHKRIPVTPKNESETLLERWHNNQMTNLVEVYNKQPVWSDDSQCFWLNFQGRVTQASAKNFQLVHRADEDYIQMQFGRISENVFTMDYNFPMSALQAFSIVLTSFETKLA